MDKISADDLNIQICLGESLTVSGSGGSGKITLLNTKEISIMADRVIVMRSGEIMEQHTNDTSVSVKSID